MKSRELFEIYSFDLKRFDTENAMKGQLMIVSLCFFI